MPLTALDELRKAAEERNDDRYAALADIVDAHQGLWCPEAEEFFTCKLYYRRIETVRML